MIRLYAPILILQLFCFYHIIKTRKEFYWYLIILFLPLIGSIIYLYINFINRKNIETVSEGIKEIVVTNYELDKLEKENEFKSTIGTRVALANGYMKYDRYSDAITLYESCLEGIHKDDPEIQKRILKAYYHNSDYNKVAEIGKRLEQIKPFNNSEEKIYYAWALAHLDKNNDADSIFQEMDHPFSNYLSRIEYSKFLINIGKQDLAKKKFEELNHEFKSMDSYEKRLNSRSISELKELRSSLNG